MDRRALLDQIYGAVSDPAGWPDVLVAVSDHLEDIGGMLVYHAPPVART